MKLFRCQACGQLLYFENTVCEKCGRRLGYIPDLDALSALQEEGRESGSWKALATVGTRLRSGARGDRDQPYRFCANARYNACNWLIRADRSDAYCTACRHNRTIPDLGVPENLARWQKLELAKHRLFYTLLRLGLPVPTRAEDREGLAFDFLADPPCQESPRVLTGHDNGLITINVGEADEAERERMRSAMGEPYRTLLGHFRHEVGHFYWEQLVRKRGNLDGFRNLFGDEREDYGKALQRHYAQGATTGWQKSFISTYATSHPWEDWAETWAHYLHILDTLEMASAFGMRIRPKVSEGSELAAVIDEDPHEASEIDQLIAGWLPLSFAVNSLNRSMGQPDLYPFILSAQVIEKMGYVHALVRAEA